MDSEKILHSFYPFANPKPRDPELIDSTLAESVRQKVKHHRSVVDEFFAENADEVVAMARSVAGVYRSDRRLFTMGNGGSSCDASHVAVEFSHPVTTGRPALTAIDLTADRSMMTAVANDVGFENVYARQIIAQGKPGDGLIGLSTSGNSDNLARAFERAKKIGMVTMGLAGKSGGRFTELELDHCLLVRTDSIHRIQECHVIIYHVLWDLVHSILADDRHVAASSVADSRDQRQKPKAPRT